MTNRLVLSCFQIRIFGEIISRAISNFSIVGRMKQFFHALFNKVPYFALIINVSPVLHVMLIFSPNIYVTSILNILLYIILILLLNFTICSNVHTVWIFSHIFHLIYQITFNVLLNQQHFLLCAKYQYSSPISYFFNYIYFCNQFVPNFAVFVINHTYFFLNLAIFLIFC